MIVIVSKFCPGMGTTITEEVAVRAGEIYTHISVSFIVSMLAIDHPPLRRERLANTATDSASTLS